MIDYLGKHIHECIAIALDHDLEMKRDRDGRCVDCGTGREVADYLANIDPVCPIIIHTTNSDAATGMIRVLKERRWKIRRVLPCDDMQWINDAWFPAVRRAIVGPIAKQTVALTGRSDA